MGGWDILLGSVATRMVYMLLIEGYRRRSRSRSRSRSKSYSYDRHRKHRRRNRSDSSDYSHHKKSRKHRSKDRREKKKKKHKKSRHRSSSESYSWYIHRIYHVYKYNPIFNTKSSNFSFRFIVEASQLLQSWHLSNVNLIFTFIYYPILVVR